MNARAPDEIKMIHVLSQLPSSTTTDDEPRESAISFVMNEPKKNREHNFLIKQQNSFDEYVHVIMAKFV